MKKETAPKPKPTIKRITTAYGRLMCQNGFHKWGKIYHTAGHDWCFGMGHPAQDCTREGCDYTLRHSPS